MSDYRNVVIHSDDGSGSVQIEEWAGGYRIRVEPTGTNQPQVIVGLDYKDIRRLFQAARMMFPALSQE